MIIDLAQPLLGMAQWLKRRLKSRATINMMSKVILYSVAIRKLSKWEAG
jgi:hypothetical protein